VHLLLARPRYNNTTRQWFDGLIGIYPVGEFDMVYKRWSANHKRGDLKWTSFTLKRWVPVYDGQFGASWHQEEDAY
jgi:hypothetical protein